MNKTMKAPTTSNAAPRLMVHETSPERLSEFFAELRLHFLPERLTSFLAAYKNLREDIPPPVSKPERVTDPLRTKDLERFFDDFRGQYSNLKKEGAFIDLWEVACLGRDELRNTSVLAWFLDPTASHGFGAEVFHAWISSLPLPEKLAAILNSRPENYRVSTEICPLSNQKNRFDIEVDGNGFYLCIEVKIGAGEGDQQLERYREATGQRACGDEWALIYLTPNPPPDLAIQDGRLVSSTWKDVSRSVRAHPAWKKWAQHTFPFQLLKQFLQRCEQF